MNTLPEVAEAAATGQVRRLYTDIRQVMGVPLVNLVYRHLATQPEALDWAWGAVRPHFVSGAVHTQAQALRQAVDGTVGAWGVVFPGHGWPPGLAAVAGAYSMGNSLNLVALTALLQAAGGPPGAQADAVVGVVGAAEGAAGPVEPAPASPASAPAPLPALPSLQELPPDVLARIHRLNRFAETGEPSIVASLYRHLAVWPGVLRDTEALLAPLQQRGALDQARDATAAAAATLAARQPLAMPPPVVAFEAFRPRIDQLARVTIPKMVPVSVLLQRLLAEPCIERRESSAQPLP
ncbi:MAG: hypothetical protein V4505_10825 [Pseudomonadota bacterium]